MPELQHYILATAGHVDHGKSALVKALTGTDPDRLPEEKARGITIDLGFAWLELPPDPAGDRGGIAYGLGIVDVPGHEDFVKNMVAGVGSVDLALLVVAADDGWMPQTEEHLQILTYLGVTRAVVALTKMDLRPAAEAEVSGAIRGRLQASALAGAPIVPVSVVTGAGLARLRVTLRAVLAGMPRPRDLGKPRLAVDRVFSRHGVGTIVTGTLIGGCLRRGQSVVVQPTGVVSRIRSLQTHNRDYEVAGPGTRTALNLADLEAQSQLNPTGVGRGQVVTLKELGAPHDTLDVWLEKSARLVGGTEPAARPLRQGALVRMHHGSTNVRARVHLYGLTELAAGAEAAAQLRLDAPLFVFAGDRFIIRDWPEQATLAGGVILDPEATRRGRSGGERVAFLAARRRHLADPAVFVAGQLGREGVALRSQLLLQSNFSREEVGNAVERLTAERRIVLLGEWVAEADWWSRLRQTAVSAIDAEHRVHPDREGLGLNELRSSLGAAAGVPGMFERLLADLTGGDFVQNGNVIQRASHQMLLPPDLRAAGERVRAALRARPFDPPSRKELAPDASTQQALRFLVKTGEAIEISSDVVMSSDAYREVGRVIRAYLLHHGRGTVSELRQAVGSSRRVMVPLLERMDREGQTRREGDVRVAGKPCPPTSSPMPKRPADPGSATSKRPA